MPTHVNYDNLLELLAGVAQNLKGKISNIDLTDQQKSQLSLIDKIIKTGTGTKYLSNDGTYKNIPLDQMANMTNELGVIYDLLKIQSTPEQWTTNYKSMSTSRMDFGCIQYNGKIYSIGGYNGGFTDKVEVYDILSNTWTVGASMPTSRYAFCHAEYNGKIYCIGGQASSGSFVGTVEIYDILSNTWAVGATMPTSRIYLRCIQYNGKIYCIGGSSLTNKVEVYDINSNTWSTNYNPMPTSRHSFGCIVYNGKIYCIGGTNGSNLNKVEVYDITSNTWTTNYNPMPTSRFGLGCVQYNGKIYCIGGGDILKKVEVYDIPSNGWNTSYIDMPTSRRYFGCIYYKGNIYCIGGYNGGYLTIVEKYQLQLTSYDITLPLDISNKLSLLVTNGTGTKLLTDNGTYQEYIPSGYRELTTDELNNAIDVIKSNII